MSVKPAYVVIVGAGQGLGRAVAQRFSKHYPIAVLARTPASYESTVTAITSAGGKCIGIPCDVSSPTSVTTGLTSVRAAFPGHAMAAAVFNPGGGFLMKGFLETTKEEFDTALDVQAGGLFNFAKEVIPDLLKSVEGAEYPPTLLVTSATAALKGSARFGAFAAGKTAQRALSQSLAREFGPKGVHVANIVVDGIIKGPRMAGFQVNGGAPDGRIDPAAIAESYWNLHVQPRSAFTHELDIRPYVEKW